MTGCDLRCVFGHHCVCGGGIVNGIRARFIELILKHLEVRTKLRATLMEPRDPEPGSDCLCCSYRIDVVVQPQHWDHSSSNKTAGRRPRFSRAEWGLHGEKEQTAQLLLPPATFLCADVLWLPRAARCCQDQRWENPVYWIVSRPAGGLFGHPSIHSFVPDNAASQRRFQAASERLCICQRRRMPPLTSAED